MAETTTNKDRLKDITESIEAGIKELFQSDKYAQYLQTMSRFHRYSVNNTMLIYLQKPDATLVAGFNKWRDQFERNVMKGEKGIKIIAPTPFKKKIEQEKLDPDTKQPIYDADGNTIMEEKVIKIPMYKPVTVFDVSQTDGKPLPELAANLTGDVQNYDVFMEALRRSAPVPITFEKMSGMDGYFSVDEQRIAIQEGMSEVQTVSAAVHEIAHSKLHNQPKTEDADAPKRKDRNTEEVEAESISYAVCAYYGIATAENSFGYIATWSKDKELPELRASLETINRTSSELISDIDRNYSEIMRERGLDKVEPEQQPGYEQWSEPANADNAPEQPDVPSDNVATYLPNEAPPVPEIGVQEQAPITAPDNGYLPDPAMTIEAMNAYGYTDADMLPLSRERAIELFERDVAVYMLYEDNTEAMAFDTDEIITFEGMLGVTAADWELAPADLKVQQRDVEQTFLSNPTDCFAIYQLKPGEDTRYLRFESLAAVTAAGQTVERENYEPVYTGSFTKFDGTRDRLEDLFDRFNNDRPADFHGHSLSVSDIVALKQSGQVSYHYVDSFDFAVLPDFKKPENYLKNAEMAMEDDYGMIDGVINNGPKQPTVAELEQQVKSGQSISLMDLAGAVHRERTEKRSSVLEQLKSHGANDVTNKTAPKRSAEREI
ncbi:MAG: YodL domain-containing protein [Oscillospiraceae bacterium]|nr:YodL domain-containing protein [Oscillospiraceae bacterium]